MFNKSCAIVKGEDSASITMPFSKFGYCVPAAVKSVQVSCMNRIYDGFGIRNDRGGMEFFCEASKDYIEEPLANTITQLQDKLDRFQAQLSNEQVAYEEGLEDIHGWAADLQLKEENLSLFTDNLQQLIEQGKADTIEETERERRRYALRRKIYGITTQIEKYKERSVRFHTCHRKISHIETLIAELESFICDMKRQRSILSTFTIGKSDILTFSLVDNRRQKSVCVFANILDYLSYIALTCEADHSELPKNCDCIVLNAPVNFMKMLVSVDVYDDIFCFFPDTILYKTLEATVIQRDAPRAHSMSSFFSGSTSLYNYLMRRDDKIQTIKNDMTMSKKVENSATATPITKRVCKSKNTEARIASSVFTDSPVAKMRRATDGRTKEGRQQKINAEITALTKKRDDLKEELAAVESKLSRTLADMKYLPILLSAFNALTTARGGVKLVKPENGSLYWYIRAMPNKKSFEVVDSQWNDWTSDHYRYCKGNMFLDEKTCIKACTAMNDMLSDL